MLAEIVDWNIIKVLHTYICTRIARKSKKKYIYIRVHINVLRINRLIGNMTELMVNAHDALVGWEKKCDRIKKRQNINEEINFRLKINELGIPPDAAGVGSSTTVIWIVFSNL